jgi:phospholipid/cholesterol/gamma-HCH transport system ATP-binding protein
MATPKIELKNISKAFGNKKVLDGVNLKIPKGCSLVILGGSGTGKSVTIKCIQKLLEQDSGDVFIDGKNIGLMKEKEFANIRDKMGMLFQGAALFDSLKVWENICFKMLQNPKTTNKEARDRAAELLKSVGLDSKVMDLFPSELSGGMQKRVGLARAVAGSPEIIFFDEPTTGLDPIMAEVINDLIIKHVKELGATAVTITHDIHSAERIADRVAMLYQGKIIWQDDVKKLRKSGNAIVNQFINGLSKGPIKL